jgi:DNA-binding NarL/FixJ family response regulator
MNKTNNLNDQELLEQISKKLSALIAVSLTKDAEKMTNAKRVEILGRFGLYNQDIADILGTTKPTIEVLKSRIKRGNK